MQIRVIPSGFPSLDKEYMLLKDMRSELIVVGGRPSHGKSAFMFQLAFNVATSGMPAHVFSLEMDADQDRARRVAALINKPLGWIQSGRVPDAEIEKARDTLAGVPYFIDDRAGLTIHQLCDAARTAKKAHGTKLVVVDYLQLLRSEKGHSKDDEVGAITKELKILAKELRCPVVIGSQLNRECEKRGKQLEYNTQGNNTSGYEPVLSDLRESGNIEQDADMVLLVHQQNKYTGERAGEADIVVAKNRNGPVGKVVFGFSATQTKFIDRSTYARA